MKKAIKFGDLVGKKFKFYGAAENQFRLGKTTWMVMEDEDDGYRSMLGSIEIPKTTTHLFRRAIAEVKLTALSSSIFDGYQLTDVKDGHVWLQFGTDESADYYPCFVFHYEPKPAKKAARK